MICEAHFFIGQLNHILKCHQQKWLKQKQIWKNRSVRVSQHRNLVRTFQNYFSMHLSFTSGYEKRHHIVLLVTYLGLKCRSL